MHSNDQGDIAGKHADIAGLLFKLARTAVEQFATDGNVDKCSGRLLQTLAGWGSVYMFDADMFHKFHEAAAPLVLESTETQSQLGVLAILGNEARLWCPERRLCAETGREPTAEDPSQAIQMFESPKSLVR